MDEFGNYLSMPEGYRWATPDEVEECLSWKGWDHVIGVRDNPNDDEVFVSYAVKI